MEAILEELRLLRAEAREAALRTEAREAALRAEAREAALRTEAREAALRAEAREAALRMEARIYAELSAMRTGAALFSSAPLRATVGAEALAALVASHQISEAAAPGEDLSAAAPAPAPAASAPPPPPFRGPAADSALGERLIDVLGIVAAMGFACEVSHCLYLCGETWRRGDRGATNDMIARSLERQCGASAARAAKREGGRTQLMRAVKANNLPRVLQLVQRGAPLEVRSNSGHTALQWTCNDGQKRIAKALLDGKYEGHGAEVDALDRLCYPPLMLASMNGHEGVVRLLLARGAKVATRTSGGSTALSWATRRGHAACEALLRAHGAKG